MINKTAVLQAEKILFNSILSQNILKKYDNEVKKIIEVYTNDDEIKNLIDIFNLTTDDFENIYIHLLNSFEFCNLIYVQDTPCLFATALMLNIPSIISMANRIYYNLQKNNNRHEILIESADLTARIFFHEQSIQQNIASIQHFCRNGIYCNLRK